MKHKSLTASMVLLGVGIAFSVWGDSTTLNISNGAATVISPASSTLSFPISRTGDTSYDAFLQYQTVDGTAVAGVDYTAASGSIVIPAGQSSATIPVTIAGRLNNPPNKTFQMLLLGNGGAGMGFTSSFATQQTFGTDPTPYSVTAADLNGDGLPDLIVVNRNPIGTLSVLLNTTAPGGITPSFAAEQSFATGSLPGSVTVADINGDGLPDLIVANEGNNNVSVLINKTAPGAATASFAAPQAFATEGDPRAVRVADVNGDGLPDLVVPNGGSNTVSVLLNTTAPGAATPSFAAQQTFATGNQPFSATVADVNGDGLPDLIVTNYADSTASVLLNNTAPGANTASFATQQIFPVGGNPITVTAADVNGDGLHDLIVANSTNPGTVSVLLNTTAPGATTSSFAARQTFATGIAPISVTAADMNGDGKPDLVVANIVDNTVSVLLNATAPGAAASSFVTRQDFITGNTPISVTAADINGDGKPDLIAANISDGTVSVLLNTTPAPATTFDGNSFGAHHEFGTGTQPFSVTAADVNGDGKPDLIVANAAGSNLVSVLLNTTATGATTPSFATQQTFSTNNNPESVTVADVNGDGKPDLIVANAGGNTVSVLLNTTAPGASTSSFATQQAFAVGSSPFSVTAADVNGDGLPDLIAANDSDNTVSVLLNTTAPGAATPSFTTQQTFATGKAAGVKVADINGDGMPDLIVANIDNTASVLINTTAPGATTPSFATQQTFATGGGVLSLTTADVNGDGLPDFITANQNNSNVSVLLNTTARGASLASFATQQTFAVGPAPFSVTAADLNGDGKPDLITANFNSNTTVSVLLNTTVPGAATPSFATQQTFTAGSDPISVTTADLNGDGQPDLIVANYADNTVSVLLNALYTAIASGSPATGTIHYAIPQTTASLTALAFGYVPVGDTVTKNITVKNTGAHPLYIGSVSSNDAEFAATGATTCPGGGLAPTMTCTIAIGFTPSALGSHSATLSVNDNTATSPQHVTATGTGTVDLTVTPTSAAFGSVKIGSKATKTITVINKQTMPISLTLPPGFTGTNLADFNVTGGTCTSTLAAKMSCTLIVTYAPTQLGTESATMTITDSPDTLGPYLVSFTTGQNIPATVTPSTLAFGTLTVRTSPKSANLAVTNLSGFSLSVSEGSPSGPNAGDFAVTGGTCGGTVSPHSICTIAITFTPTVGPTAESASIAVSVGSDPTSPHHIALTGTGP